MKGVVKYARGNGFVELQDVENRPPAPTQMKIEVRASGVCGSDVHIYHDSINYPIRTPVVMGHEFSGVVVEKGAQVGDEVELGDRVTAEPSIHLCGKCIYCRSEHYNLCPERKVLGYWYDGCFAPYCNVVIAHKLPDNVSFEAGATTELLACCVHAVSEQVGVSAGDFVVVTGPGPVGLSAALVALAEGATVLICGTSADRRRLRLAEELGVHYAVDVEAGDAVKRVRELTTGYGADAVVECSGAPAAMGLGLILVRKRGKYAQMGLPGRPVEIDFEQIAYKEIQVIGALAQRRPVWKRALKLMEQGLIPSDKLITHQFVLSEWQHAFDLAERREGMKLMFMPQA